jgi:hypothetical protein
VLSLGGRTQKTTSAGAALELSNATALRVERRIEERNTLNTGMEGERTTRTEYELRQRINQGSLNLRLQKEAGVNRSTSQPTGRNSF